MEYIQDNLIDDRYRIRRAIGRGGFATVYLALDEQLQREVAIKVMTMGVLYDDERRKRLLREAKALASLKHPGIIEVHRLAFFDDGRPYVVMEYFDGESLADKLKREGPLNCTDAAVLCRRIGEPLAHAHSYGVLHRDLKPANVLVSKEPGSKTVKLVDFGLSTFLEAINSDQTRLTRTGAAVGSPEYMSPEQCRGEAVDARTDIYALGLVLFEILTGRQAFGGSDIVTTMKRQLQDPLAKLECVDHKEKMIPLLEEILTKSTTKSKDERYPDVSSMLADLSTLAAKNSQSNFKSLTQSPSPVQYGWYHVALVFAMVIACSIMASFLLLQRTTVQKSPKAASSFHLYWTVGEIADLLINDSVKLQETPPSMGQKLLVRDHLTNVERNFPSSNPELDGLLTTTYALYKNRYGEDGSGEKLVMHGFRWLKYSALKGCKPDMALFAARTLCDELLDEHKFAQIKEISKILDEAYGNHPDIAGVANEHILEARILLASGQRQAAWQKFEQAVHMVLAPGHPASNDWLSTVRYLDQYLQDFPAERANLDYRRQLLRYWLEACENPDRALETTMDGRAHIWIELGEIERALGNHQEAINAFQKSKSLASMALRTSAPSDVPKLQSDITAATERLRNADQHQH